MDPDLVSHPILALSNALNGATGMCCQQWHYWGSGPYVQGQTMCRLSEKNGKEIIHGLSSIPMQVDLFCLINLSLRHFDGRYTLVSRPFMSMAQWSLSLCFRCRGGMGGFFRSGGGGRTPSSSCMRRATSGGMCSGLPPGGGGWKLPLFC